MHGYSFYSDNGFLLRVCTEGFYYEILIITYPKLVKMTGGTFFKSQKGKNRLINYEFLFN